MSRLNLAQVDWVVRWYLDIGDVSLSTSAVAKLIELDILILPTHEIVFESLYGHVLMLVCMRKDDEQRDG